MNMENFINADNMVRTYPIKNRVEIANVGYNDFHTVKPQKYYWIDNNTTLHFVISGKGYLFFGGKKYELKKGDMFLLPQGEKRMYYPDANDPWEYIWFGMKGESYGFLAETMGLSRENAVAQSRNYEQILEEYGELKQKIRNGNDNGFFALGCLYRILHIQTSKHYSGIDGAKIIIDENFTQKDFSVENLCRTVGMSHSELCRKFKKELGATPLEYLTSKRMEYCKVLLRETTLSVTAIAYSCGYSDALHFMKKFKKMYNCTCIEYRNSK